MGVFDFFKKKVNQTKFHREDKMQNYSTEISPILQKNQAILRDESKSFDERNAAYLAIRDEEVWRLNEAYDFNSIEGINSIPVPCREVNGDSVTGRVEYYLHKKCFADHWNAGRTELALACLRKAQELMFVSDMMWSRMDFLRLVEYLYEAGHDEEAETQLKRIDDFFKPKNIQQNNCPIDLGSAEYFGTDLVEVYSHSPYCKECAKYVNRIYSISGKDKRFPPFETATNGCSHRLSCLSFAPFIFGVNEPTFECRDIVKYSNRPFRDERSHDEAKRYDDWVALMQKTKEDESRQEANMIERAKAKMKDTQTLQWLHENLPSIAPKSLSGFRRMRTTKSMNYQKLVEAAKALGKNIEK